MPPSLLNYIFSFAVDIQKISSAIVERVEKVVSEQMDNSHASLRRHGNYGGRLESCGLDVLEWVSSS